MKIKRDFVTNSSSCSFILLGFKIPDDGKSYESIDKKIEDYEKKFSEDYYIGFGSEGGAPNDETIIIGRMIYDHIDEYTEFQELDFNKNIDDVIEIAKEFDVSAENIKYIIGTRMC